MKPKMILYPVLFCITHISLLHAAVGDPPSPNETVLSYSTEYLSRYDSRAVIFAGRVHEPVPLRTESVYMRDRNSKEYNYSKKESIPQPVPTDESYARGTLLYDGTLYKDVWLRLDLLTDQLVVRTPDRLYGIVLLPERVGYADFHGYRVVYVPPGDDVYRLPGGFYRELYDGPIRVIGSERIIFDPADQKFKSWSVRYYILKDGRYERVRNSKGSVLSALGGFKKELSRFIKENRLSVKNDTENALVRIVAEYEKLNEQAGL